MQPTKRARRADGSMPRPMSQSWSYVDETAADRRVHDATFVGEDLIKELMGTTNLLLGTPWKQVIRSVSFGLGASDRLFSARSDPARKLLFLTVNADLLRLRPLRFPRICDELAVAFMIATQRAVRSRCPESTVDVRPYLRKRFAGVLPLQGYLKVEV